jgi:hypothetical protein
VVDSAVDTVVQGTGDLAAKAVQLGESAVGSVKSAGQQAVGIIGLARAVSRVSSPNAPREKVIEEFTRAVRMPMLGAMVDAKADAIAIGYTGELEVGLGGTTGAEILYIRAKDGTPAQLRVHDLNGALAVSSVGAGIKAFVRCAYGDPATLAGAHGRTGVAFGALGIANTGFYTVPGPDGAPPGHGYLAAVGITPGVGVIPGTEASISNFWEKATQEFELTPAEVEALEASLAGASDKKWLRDRAQSLGGVIDRVT